MELWRWKGLSAFFQITPNVLMEKSLPSSLSNTLQSWPVCFAWTHAAAVYHSNSYVHSSLDTRVNAGPLERSPVEEIHGHLYLTPCCFVLTVFCTNSFIRQNQRVTRYQ